MNDFPKMPAKRPPNQNRSGRMVEFLLSLEFENMSPDLVRDARNRLLDALGCGLYGAQMPWGKIAAKVVYEDESRGAATIYGNRVPAARVPYLPRTVRQ